MAIKLQFNINWHPSLYASFFNLKSILSEVSYIFRTPPPPGRKFLGPCLIVNRRHIIKLYLKKRYLDVYLAGRGLYKRTPALSSSGVTLKSDPVEKWLPGSFFNVKNDSPGHFSTLKADTVQILTLNFEPKVVKKWLPHEILTSMGVIFQRFLHI